jgi:hypothetical protein
MAYDEGAYPNNKELSKGSPADAVRVYQLVRYAEGGAVARSLSAGEVVVWDCVSDDGVTIGLAGTVGSADAVAGVVISSTIRTSDNAATAANSVGSRNWGYIQTYGICNSAMVQSTAVAGQAIGASDTASYGIPLTNSSGNYRAVFGFALDAVSSTAEDVEIFIKNR